MSLSDKLDKIRSSPKLQNQHETAIVLNAVEETLRDQKTEPSPTAYFAAVLALLNQSISPTKGIVNKELATSLVYLLDLVTPHVPQALLRSKFSQILTNLAPALTHQEAEAPLLRPSIGCLESLLIAQDAAAWALAQNQIGPRRAVSGLLNLAVDRRPKVRKRAQDALTTVLKHPPPSPSLDHPAADMCAETALKSLKDVAVTTGSKSKQRRQGHDHQHEPGLIHGLQLVKTIATASGGWPSRKIEPLCEVLLDISKSPHDYLTMAAFEVFEAIFEGMANEFSSPKLPRLMEVIIELRPFQEDSQLLPPWIAVVSRGYDVSAQVDPEATFHKLPEIFRSISEFLASSSHNIRVSASECLISFMANCVPDRVLLEPSIHDEKILERLAKSASDLLTVKYQAAWMEVFNVLSATFETLRWKSAPLLSGVVRAVGELRGSESFNGKTEADGLLAKAISAMGPENVLAILPLNLMKPQAGQPGRAWLLPLLRDNVSNTRLAHFKAEFVPLSETIFQRVIENGQVEKTMEIKIFETLVQQIWAVLPGYCDLPLDLTQSFDQNFAELLANILYKQADLRGDLCRALQNLVDSNKAVLALEGEDLLAQRLVSKLIAKENLSHLKRFSSNILAVLFNIYSETLPQYRGFILRCINAYLSIVPQTELMNTFTKVISTLESSLDDADPQTQADKQKRAKADNKMPPLSHTLLDLVITIAIYLPQECFATLFAVAARIVFRDDDPQLQKKAYKLVPRLAESDNGKLALQLRNVELQQLLLNSAAKASIPARRGSSNHDRLAAIAQVVHFLPQSDLHFIPSILSEVAISTKETNEKARTAAFELLVLMGEKMQQGGIVVNAKVSHMPDGAPNATASLEEYITMVSAGLAGSTPHMVSASITALTRLLYHFRESLSTATVTEMITTMDLFLTSSNREIVRSVLGFVKVSVISLPTSLMLPRLASLIPNLMVWSHEHKAQFKVRVKNIVERMIRRFGVEVVEKWCPEADKKLISNIRKTRERRKRRKVAGGDDKAEADARKKKGRFESEYDEAVYGSDDSDEGSEISDTEVLGRDQAADRNKGPQTFIVEDEDEPLDLLDSRALANISTTKPLKARQPPTKKTKAKMDVDGRLLLGGGDNEHDDALMMDYGENGDASKGKPGDGLLEGGINAYIDAIKGKDAVQRGQKGKLKFSNKRGKDDGAMEIDEGEISQKLKPGKQNEAATGGHRKGLGMTKTRGGRVMKNRGGRRGRR
ncbi:MAG: hypothetical protein M1836_004843 [Candelina mexicana]|nr:MAG: hypothetical protein M1836_004843 [Candelina mexicana]